MHNLRFCHARRLCAKLGHAIKSHIFLAGNVVDLTLHRGIADTSFGAGTPQKKTNMSTENPPLEDVFPIEIGDIPMSC